MVSCKHFISGPFSRALTSLVVEALKLVCVTLVIAVSNANCVVNIAITLNFEWVGSTLSSFKINLNLFFSHISIQQCFCLRIFTYLQPVHEPGGIESDDGSVCHHCPHLHSKCNWNLPGDFCSLNITRWNQPIKYLQLASSDYLNALHALSWMTYFPQIMRGEQHHLIKGPMARFWGGKGSPLLKGGGAVQTW